MKILLALLFATSFYFFTLGLRVKTHLLRQFNLVFIPSGSVL